MRFTGKPLNFATYRFMGYSSTTCGGLEGDCSVLAERFSVDIPFAFYSWVRSIFQGDLLRTGKSVIDAF